MQPDHLKPLPPHGGCGSHWVAWGGLVWDGGHWRCALSERLWGPWCSTPAPGSGGGGNGMHQSSAPSANPTAAQQTILPHAHAHQHLALSHGARHAKSSCTASRRQDTPCIAHKDTWRLSPLPHAHRLQNSSTGCRQRGTEARQQNIPPVVQGTRGTIVLRGAPCPAHTQQWLSRAPSLCPATVPLTPNAGLNGVCNRQ